MTFHTFSVMVGMGVALVVATVLVLAFFDVLNDRLKAKHRRTPGPDDLWWDLQPPTGSDRGGHVDTVRADVTEVER